MKAAELGDSRLKLKIGEEMKKEERANECMRLSWTASELGQAEIRSKLVEIFRKGTIVKKEIKSQRDYRRRWQSSSKEQ